MTVIKTLVGVAIAALVLSFGSPAIASAGDDVLPGDGEQHTSVEAVQQLDGSVLFDAGNSGITVLPAPEARMSNEALAGLAQTFTCDLKVHHPHGSTHVNGTINVVAKVECQIVPGNIRLATELWRVGANYTRWTAPTKNTDTKSWLQNNASTSCSAGPADFRGWAWGTIQAPAGYTLVGPADYDKEGDIVPVACGLNRMSDTPESDSSETITITFIRTDLVDK